MERRVVNPWTWQDKFGFVQANAISNPTNFLICAGQTSVDADGNPMHAGDMAAQLNQAMDNVETVLAQAGFSLPDIVRLNYYTTDVDRFLEASGTIGPRLGAAGCRPASTLLGVSRLAFPEFLIEIEVTAAK
ncbi:MAG: RidA family protein [Thermomicrobiales bacterium]